jgi:hypothetical protein
MSVKFNVVSGFNFQSDSYVVVFNTANPNDTNTVTPVAEAVQNGFAGYSLAIAVGGTGGAVTAQAFYYYRPSSSSQYPQLFPLNPTQQQLIFNNNSNGAGTQFQVIFDRVIALANGPASPSASVSPTTVPSGVAVTQYWTFNFFTVSGTLQQYEAAQNVTIIDSLGAAGPSDASYQSPLLNVATPFDTVFVTRTGNHPVIPDAIAGGEIANNP